MTTKPHAHASCLLLALVAVAVTSRAADVPTPASPDASAIDVVLFLDRSADAAAVETQITGLLGRAGALAGGAGATASEPLVTVVRRTPAEPSAHGDAVSFHVTLPEGASREAFLRALAQDEACRASRESCAAHCKLIEAVATGGHWHLKVPVDGRQCLAVFAAGDEQAAEVRRIVLARPEQFGLRRKPRIGTLKVTFGRPDFGGLPR